MEEENLSLLLWEEDEPTPSRQETAELGWNQQLDWGASVKGSGGRQMFPARLGVLKLLGLDLRPLEGALRCDRR